MLVFIYYCVCAYDVGVRDMYQPWCTDEGQKMIWGIMLSFYLSWQHLSRFHLLCFIMEASIISKVAEYVGTLPSDDQRMLHLS